MSGSIKALRLINLLVGGGLTYTQLNTELSNAMNKGAFSAALRQRDVYDALLMSYVARPVIIASSGAMECIAQNSNVIDYAIEDTLLLTEMAASSVAMLAITSNYYAMENLASTQTSFNTVFGSSVARSAIYASDTALAALQSTAVRDIARAYSAYQQLTISNASSTSPKTLGLTGNAIMFEGALSGTGSMTIANRRAGSTQGNVTTWDPVATTLPGDSNVVALQNTATVATSTSAARNSLFGIIYV